MEEHSSKTPTWFFVPQAAARPLLPPQSPSAVTAATHSTQVTSSTSPRSFCVTGARLEPGCQAEWGGREDLGPPGGSTKAAEPTVPLASPLVVPKTRLVLENNERLDTS